MNSTGNSSNSKSSIRKRLKLVISKEMHANSQRIRMISGYMVCYL